MSNFVDFGELKERVSFEQAIQLLGLQMKQSGNQWRGPCPHCKGGGERALVVTEGKGFFCFAMKKGGDQIALVAHVKDCSTKDAAQFLSGTVPTTVPKEEAPKPEGGMQALQYLEPEHEAVVAVGFDPAFAKRHGIGWAGKGIARGHVCIPFRDEDGKLLGYVGVTEAWLPADFTVNVVKFEKKSA